MKGGPGQFLANLPDGTAVTDAMIETWQKKALDLARKGHGELKRLPSGTYHAYVDLGTNIGYSDGKLTSRMRVEWTAGSVHSHPR